MRVIVLAAGQGTRLRPHTNTLPKALVPLEPNFPLLAHTVGALVENPAVHDVRIVTGYCAERVESFLHNWRFPKAHAAYNPRFASHGPSLSVWTGIEDWDGPVIVMNGDTYFERRSLADVIRRAVVTAQSSTLFGSSVTKFDSDDVRIAVGQGNIIERVGKNLDDAQAAMKSAGILSLRTEQHSTVLKNYLRSVSQQVVAEPRTWHEAINHLIEMGVAVSAAGIPINAWREVDCVEDLALAQRDFRLHKIDQFQEEEAAIIGHSSLSTAGVSAI